MEEFGYKVNFLPQSSKVFSQSSLRIIKKLPHIRKFLSFLKKVICEFAVKNFSDLVTYCLCGKLNKILRKRLSNFLQSFLQDDLQCGDVLTCELIRHF